MVEEKKSAEGEEKGKKINLILFSDCAHVDIIL